MPRSLKYLWWWISGRSTWREYRLRCRLKTALLDPNTALFPIMLWSHVEEDTPAHSALSAALFDSSGDEPEDHAPQKDLSNPNVRRKVIECVDDHPEILKAFKKLLREFDSLPPPPAPWRVAEIDRLPFSDNVFSSCAKLIEQACEPFGTYQIAFGTMEADGSPASLVPITDVVADDEGKEIILKTCPAYSDLQPPPTILTVTELKSRFISLLSGRETHRVECSEGSQEDSEDGDVMEFRVDYPVNAIGHNKDHSIFAFIYQGQAT